VTVIQYAWIFGSNLHEVRLESNTVSALCCANRPVMGGWNQQRGGFGGDLVMRPAQWTYILMGVLTCSVSYQFLKEPSLPNPSLGVPSESEWRPLDHNSDRPLIYEDEARLQVVDPAPADSKPDQLSIPQDQERLKDAGGTGSIEFAAPNDTQNLSYLAYYAYSELPPETKPADMVLNALKAVPPGTPVEEIKRVADILRLDFTFMKTVAKIESNFNPKQRTGSYIGLFQLSKYEFQKYGSGDILVPRDNAVSAALKFMTEAILFEMFTHRKPTLNDLYLIHQQGVDGAAEHVSHPNRLAWKSMCATDEGKEKGDKWCKRAIWGNTLPAIKRVWKNVNNVTSGAFVAMWQQRVSHFYSRYADAAAN
jgi:hypothetical protein